MYPDNLDQSNPILAKQIEVLHIELPKFFNKSKHLKNFDYSKISKIFSETLQNFNYIIDVDNFGVQAIHIWGSGIPRDNKIIISWNKERIKNGSIQTWQEGFQDALDRVRKKYTTASQGIIK